VRASPPRLRASLLGLAVALVLGVFILEMSGSAPRGAGSDHISPAVFAATVPGGGTVCQPIAPLPRDAAAAQLLIGTYGRPVPALRLRFTGTGGVTVAQGALAAGAHEGTVTIPIHRVPAGAGSSARAGGAAGAGAREAGSFCLSLGGHGSFVLGGEGGGIGASSETVNGVQQPGRVSLLYARAGSESWWQLLPTLDERFGLGKAGFFGDWTLPFAALLLLGVWVLVIRLLLVELRREPT
jgi:hypothetical protein